MNVDEFNVADSKFELQKYARKSQTELENDIYYHRELLINSIENRNIDLLTITSFCGISAEREERLVNLFPNKQTERCLMFKNKKVFFFLEILISR